MKTLKILSIIGIIIYGCHLVFVNFQGVPPLPESDWVGISFGLALSIVGLIQSKKALKK